jgi:hypothetical protein
VLPETLQPFADVLVFEPTHEREGLFLPCQLVDIRWPATACHLLRREDRVLYYGWRRGTDVLD